jgi:hypothetical protein
MQTELFPGLEEDFGELPLQVVQLVKVLEIVRIDDGVAPPVIGLAGRPAMDRRPIARALVAKAVLGHCSTRALLLDLKCNVLLRKICGWSHVADLPGESTFSRAFADFAGSDLGQRIHEGLVKQVFEGRLVGHLLRDSTAVETLERPPSRKKGEKRKKAKPTKRLEKQLSGMTLEKMIADLPTERAWGAKRNSRGHNYFWMGYKAHVDWSDCGIPISCILTSANVHDSQVAIPLATMSATRVVSLYDVMDSAYDSKLIRQHSRELGHVPITDIVRRGKADQRPPRAPHEEQRFRLRTTAERGFGRLKESFGARSVRVRGASKVMAHLMFGILALTAYQILDLAG